MLDYNEGLYRSDDSITKLLSENTQAAPEQPQEAAYRPDESISDISVNYEAYPELRQLRREMGMEPSQIHPLKRGLQSQWKHTYEGFTATAAAFTDSVTLDQIRSEQKYNQQYKRNLEIQTDLVDWDNPDWWMYRIGEGTFQAGESVALGLLGGWLAKGALGLTEAGLAMRVAVSAPMVAEIWGRTAGNNVEYLEGLGVSPERARFFGASAAAFEGVVEVMFGGDRMLLDRIAGTGITRSMITPSVLRRIAPELVKSGSKKMGIPMMGFAKRTLNVVLEEEFEEIIQEAGNQVSFALAAWSMDEFKPTYLNVIANTFPSVLPMALFGASIGSTKAEQRYRLVKEMLDMPGRDMFANALKTLSEPYAGTEEEIAAREAEYEAKTQELADFLYEGSRATADQKHQVGKSEARRIAEYFANFAVRVANRSETRNQFAYFDILRAAFSSGELTVGELNVMQQQALQQTEGIEDPNYRGYRVAEIMMEQLGKRSKTMRTMIKEVEAQETVRSTEQKIHEEFIEAAQEAGVFAEQDWDAELGTEAVPASAAQQEIEARAGTTFEQATKYIEQTVSALRNFWQSESWGFRIASEYVLSAVNSTGALALNIINAKPTYIDIGDISYQIRIMPDGEILLVEMHKSLSSSIIMDEEYSAMVGQQATTRTEAAIRLLVDNQELRKQAADVVQQRELEQEAKKRKARAAQEQELKRRLNDVKKKLTALRRNTQLTEEDAIAVLRGEVAPESENRIMKFLGKYYNQKHYKEDETKEQAETQKKETKTFEEQLEKVFESLMEEEAAWQQDAEEISKSGTQAVSDSRQMDAVAGVDALRAPGQKAADLDEIVPKQKEQDRRTARAFHEWGNEEDQTPRTETEGDGLTEKQKNKKIRGAYIPGGANFAMFLKNADAITLLHELLHHIVDAEIDGSRVMSDSVFAVLQDRYGIGPDRIWKQESSEAFVDEYLQFLQYGTEPENMAEQFQQIRKLLQTSRKILEADLPAHVDAMFRAMLGDEVTAVYETDWSNAEYLIARLARAVSGIPQEMMLDNMFKQEQEQKARFETQEELPFGMSQGQMSQVKEMAAQDKARQPTNREELANKAIAAGYTVGAYHGTPGGGFTVFDTHSDRIAYDEETDSYVRNVSGNDPTAFIGSHFAIGKDSRKVANDFASGIYQGKYVEGKSQVYSVYLKMENPRTFNAEEFETFVLQQAVAANQEFHEDWYDMHAEEYGLHPETNPLEIESESGLDKLADMYADYSAQANYQYEDGGLTWAKEVGTTIREILISEGYDSIIYENVVEGGTGAIVFDSNQIKSADPATYDDKGNEIPLSQRFDSTKNDIRYETDEVVEPTVEEIQDITLEKKNLRTKRGPLIEKRKAIQEKMRQEGVTDMEMKSLKEQLKRVNKLIKPITTRLNQLQETVNNWESDAQERLKAEKNRRKTQLHAMAGERITADDPHKVVHDVSWHVVGEKQGIQFDEWSINMMSLDELKMVHDHFMSTKPKNLNRYAYYEYGREFESLTQVQKEAIYDIMDRRSRARLNKRRKSTQVTDPKAMATMETEAANSEQRAKTVAKSVGYEGKKAAIANKALSIINFLKPSNLMKSQLPMAAFKDFEMFQVLAERTFGLAPSLLKDTVVTLFEDCAVQHGKAEFESSEWLKKRKEKIGYRALRGERKVNIMGNQTRFGHVVMVTMITEAGKNSERMVILKKSNFNKLSDKEFKQYVTECTRETLSDEQAVKFMQLTKEYYEWIYEKLDKAYYEYTKKIFGEGKHLGIVGNYTPMMREFGLFHNHDAFYEKMLTLMPVTSEYQTSDSPSIKKKRQWSEGAPIRLDAESVWIQYMRQADIFRSKSQNIIRLGEILNNPKIRSSMRDSLGSNTYMSALWLLVDRLRYASGHDKATSEWEKGLLSVYNNMTTATLFGSLFGFIRQTITTSEGVGSIPGTFQPTIDAMKYWTEMTKVIPAIQNEWNRRREIKKRTGHSPGGDLDIVMEALLEVPGFQRMRHYSPQISISKYNPSTAEYVSDMEQLNLLSHVRIKGMSLAKIGMLGYTWMDLSTKSVVWNTAFDARMRELERQGMIESQRIEDSVSYANQIVRQTQPASTQEERNLWQSGSVIGRFFTPFTGALMKRANYFTSEIYFTMKRAYTETPGGPAEKFQALMTEVMHGNPSEGRSSIAKKAAYSYLVPAMAMGMLATGGLPKDWNEFLAWLTAYNISMIPILGPAIGYMILSERENTGASPFFMDIVNSFAKLFARKPGAVEDAMRTGAQVAGVPNLFIRSLSEYEKRNGTTEENLSAALAGALGVNRWKEDDEK